jgi:hypothetical protein
MCSVSLVMRFTLLISILSMEALHAHLQEPPSEKTGQQPGTSHRLQRTSTASGRLGVCRAVTSSITPRDLAKVANLLSTDAGTVDTLVICERLGGLVEDDVGALQMLVF